MPETPPTGEQLKKAITFVSEKRTDEPGTDLVKLVDDACLRFDLSPKDSEFLSRFVKEN